MSIVPTLLHFEWLQLHRKFAAPLLISALVIVLGTCMFYLGGFFAAPENGMYSFFYYVPLAFYTLIPLLAVLVWPEEWQKGQAERLFTLPVSPFSVLAAKTMALRLLIVITLLATLPSVLIAFWLGTPDILPIFTGYLGAFLLALIFAYTALWGIIALNSMLAGIVFSYVVTGFILLVGWGVFHNFIAAYAPAYVLDVLISYSVPSMYQQLVAGVVTLKAIIFLVTISSFMATGAWLAMRAKLALDGNSIILLLWVLGAVIINGAAAYYPLQLDVTRSHAYSLPPAAQTIIEQQNVPITLTHVFSANQKDIPQVTRNYAQYVEDYLAAIHRANPEVNYVQLDPTNSAEDEANIRNAGINPINTPNGNYYYHGLMLTVGDRTATIPYLLPERRSYLAFDVISQILEAQQIKKPKLGIMTALNLGDEQVRPQFMTEIISYYDIEMLPFGVAEIPADIDAILMLVTPYVDFESLYAIDQYLVNGGRVVMLLDPLMRSAPSDDYLLPDRNADAARVDHPADLLRHYGFEYDYNALLADRSRALPISVEGMGTTSYPLWIDFGANQLSRDHIITANLSNIVLAEAGFFVPEASQTSTFTPLIRTTSAAQQQSRTVFANATTATAANNLTGVVGVRYPAIIIEDNLTSLFPNMPEEIVQYYRDFAPIGEEDNVQLPEHTVKSAQKGMVIAIADIDFLTEDFALETQLTSKGDVAQRLANDNLALLFNAVQYALNDTALIPLRGSSQAAQPTRIDRLMQGRALDYQQREQQLGAELFAVRTRRGEIEQRITLTGVNNTALQAEINTLNIREIKLNRELIALRQHIRQQLNMLERWLYVINTFTGPFILFVLFGVLALGRKPRKSVDKP